MLSGTLGQKEFWDLNDTNTYQHPFAPKDVLIDPHTIPDVVIDTKYKETVKDESVNSTLTISDIETLSLDEDDIQVNY